METKTKRSRRTIPAYIKGRKPRKCISGDVVSKDSDEAKIDRFLHRQATQAYTTWRGLKFNGAPEGAEQWHASQLVWWQHVLGTIEMMRQRNYPPGWRKHGLTK